MPNILENYVTDLSKVIIKLAQEVRCKREVSDDEFEKGRQFAFYEILSLMRQQAIVFGLNENEIGLAGVNLEEFLI
ncbi:MAG: hypothetical protein M0Z50_04840 [Planctomycetia bacterium]|nr:hypothetical protein [Planctomycetia bacterium]